MHFLRGKGTYACLLIGIIAVAVTSTFAQETTTLKCLQCKSSDNPDCLDPNKIQPTDCPTDGNAKYSQCYTKNDGGVITRDCLKEGSTTCPGDNCNACSSPGCNNQNICKKCSTDDDDCSKTDASNIKYNFFCEANTTKCFMNVKDKKVERRCATTDDTCSSDTCKTCSGSNCNAGLFPSKRIHCYQCSGSECSDVASKGSLSTPCVNYVDNDACYILGDSATSMKRGCKSDDGSPCSAGTEEGCLTCSVDNCNNSPFKKDQALKCIQCNGADCFKEQQESEAKNCAQQILYNDTESCYTLAKDGSIERGCLHDSEKIKEECSTADTPCKICNTPDGCNKQAESNKFTCIVCRSDINQKCWNDATQIPGEGCRTGDGSAETGCFNGIWNGVAIRGCFIDADEQMKVICEDKSNHQCNLCHTANCNTGKSGANSLTMYIGLLAMMLSTIWYLN